MDNNVIYRLDDDISFRKCSLYEGDKTSHGDCTNHHIRQANWTDYYCCNQEGIHLHCTHDPAVEFDVEDQNGELTLVCPKCKKRVRIDSMKSVISRCQKMLNMEIFKDAKLIRLDDWYFPEVKSKIKPTQEYFVTTDVKTDKDGDTIIILYIGYQGSKDKVQFFIKPEKGQLSTDHKDLDPSKILSKIEVTLKNRILTQKYIDGESEE